jgi:4-amino-4-deoxy-L-arabinose transferase-like glycosyltransferase
VVRPWSALLQLYQRVVYLRGPLLFLIVLLGAAGIASGWRRFSAWGWGGLCLMPWLVAVALIVGPAMTAGFSYRYVLAAVPPACLAAGLAFAGQGGGVTGWLREHGMLRSDGMLRSGS